ncbi:hypothetical protein BDN72DRAFT_845732 [Pluteus cervinus]|uniref:Uncharacterized protein n=1 Tax=Pluteus cervinus TaxID=181527 RepID=A0ACD3AH97_9AGAR|nr:hypothetical protein BDN72DRAFT_845732 [Pluteus cervinus]
MPRLMIKDVVKIVEDGSIQPTVIIFHTLNILALALVSVVLTIAMTARKIRRLRTWYIYVWTQLLLTIAFLLHPFKSSNYKPAYVPCLIQAMLVYATPPASSWAFLALVVEVYVLMQANSSILGTRFQFMLLCTPINIFVCWATLVIIEGLKHPSSVGMQSDLSYCHLSITTPAIIGAVIYLIPIVICIPLFASILLKAYRNSRVLLGERGHTVFIIPPTSILRIGVLLFAPILGFGFAYPSGELEELNRFLPLVPILTAVAFGSHTDMVSVVKSLWARLSNVTT